MKKQVGKLTFVYMLTAGAVLGLGGCELTDPASGVYGPPEAFEIKDEIPYLFGYERLV